MEVELSLRSLLVLVPETSSLLRSTSAIAPQQPLVSSKLQGSNATAPGLQQLRRLSLTGHQQLGPGLGRTVLRGRCPGGAKVPVGMGRWVARRCIGSRRRRRQTL